MPRLSEAARHLIYPSTITRSVYPEVAKKLAEVGVRFDPWQQGFGSIALGLDASGKYAATVGGVVASIPRQVGKTFTVGHLLVGLCLIFPGLRVIWTSHHLSTTGNTFQSMQGIVRKPKIFKHVDEIRLANGEQRITFANGSVVMFGARSMGFGRGMDKIDVEVFDEAQILGIKALEDMVPATNQAQNPHGALLFFIGTPPRPVDDGESFTAKRKQALDGNADDDMVYVEFSADPEADPADRSQWPVMNPSYPSRTPLESMLRMRKNLPDEDAWRREAMGIWTAEIGSGAVISSDFWQQFAAPGPVDGSRPTAFAVDASHDRQMSVSACWRSGEMYHLEEVWAGDDSSAALEWIVARTRRTSSIVIDGASPASSLISMLRGRGRSVNQTSAGDMAKACGLLEDMATAGLLTHGGQDAVSEALEGGRKRPIRDAGGWGWDRRDDAVNIAPLVSVTLALFGASLVKKTGNGRSSGGRVATVL